MASSVVGFYSLPLLRRLRPTRRDTPMTKVIGNCSILLILSSALPVLARALGTPALDRLFDLYILTSSLLHFDRIIRFLIFILMFLCMFYAGITNFDLLGNFGRIEWLGNFRIILTYNLVFGGATALCLFTKFTAAVRREIINAFRQVFVSATRRKQTAVKTD